ncbi:MAG: hypothetical protein A3A04_00580 [Candidatus Harrisonbacteria bacterium RIFCSPLOWO2_01_FULL_40_28]|uniref:Uncharacterized protein n=1 Tax=Candidatus Harrisonbacteria bacterium RIFCSPLOWO2_01_FULL_40_28 TaxID=1798406 RepID=A0A1G1ZN14_9BACT|nr:MAG: hypothetical protein A3A04_00580 [Candidatus Harrisonbacteria bacterium RIFCSPLOWO2_01_FULL_40_28]
MRKLPTIIPRSSHTLIAQKIKELFPSGCTRILFVNPAHVTEQDFNIKSARLCCYSSTLPYGPGILSKRLQMSGYITHIIDLNFEILWNAHHDPQFGYNKWRNAFNKEVESFKPHLIGISCMFSTMHGCMIDTIEHSKQMYPRIPLIAGGVHTSGFTKLNLEKCPSLDFVMRFESDLSFITFIDYANGKGNPEDLTQVAALCNTEYVEIEERNTPQEDDLNITPDYHNLPIEKYSSVGMIGAYRWLRPDARAATIVSNRGCRARCTFCTVENFNGRGVRGRRNESVVNEIKENYARYGIDHYMWIDDDLFHDEERIIKMFHAIANCKLPITWEASNGVIASATTESLVAAAACSGCSALHFGIESGSPEILRNVKKPSGIKHFHKAGRLMQKYPQIFTRGFLMLGFPSETLRQIWQTIRLACDIEMDWYSIQIVSYLGNTAMTQELLAKGLLNEQAIVDASFFVCAVGGQSHREKNEKQAARKFSLDVLVKEDDHVPSTEELQDIWFLMDFMVNYERLLRENRPQKLQLKYLFLKDICLRKTRNNPLSTMFLGVIELKLGLIEDAYIHFIQAKIFMEESAFWDIRSRVLGLDGVLKNLIKSGTIPQYISPYPT